MSTCRVIVADDHPLVRGALAEALRQLLGPAVQITDVGSLSAARQALQSDDADLLLLDLGMPGMEGMGSLSALRAEFPPVPIVVVSGAEDAATVHQAIEVGASGFIPKSSSVGVINDAVSAVLAGELWFPETGELPPGEADGGVQARFATLTAPQRQVLALAAQGKLNKEIAFELGLTEAAIKARLSQIFRKLRVRNRTQAVLIARQQITPQLSV